MTRDRGRRLDRRPLHPPGPGPREVGHVRPVPLGAGRQRPLEGDRRRPPGDHGGRRQPRRPARHPGLRRLRPAAAAARPARRAPRARRRRASGRSPASPPPACSVTKLDGQPALIVAQQTFARKLLLDKGGHWAVQDQFDSGRTSAKIEGAAAIDTDGDGVKEIALLDRTSKSLLFLAKKDGTYRPSGSLSVGPFDDFKGMHVADLDGDGRDDLLLAGTSRFGVVLTGQKGLKLKTLASYESPRNEARFGDLIVGDLNADGQPDVVLTDVAEHFVEIATFAEPVRPRQGLRLQGLRAEEPPERRRPDRAPRPRHRRRRRRRPDRPRPDRPRPRPRLPPGPRPGRRRSRVKAADGK